MTINLLERDGKDGLPEGFLELPARVYQDEPHWIPEDPEDVAAAFSPQNPYFAGREARALCVPGRGRVAAFFDPALRVDGERAAYFGYFESTGDSAVNQALMARMEGWARERGAQRLYGPIQFSTLGTYRLCLHREPGGLPFIGEPQNPSTYPAMLEDLGLRVHRGYVTQLISLDQVLTRMEFLAPLRDSLVAEGYRFEPVTAESWLRRLPQIYEMADTTFQQNFAYSRPSYEAFASALGETMLRRACPVASVLVFAPDGAPAAFGLAYPHYGALLVQGRGAERVSLRDLDYQRHRPLLAQYPPRGIIAKTMGVHPAHRRKRLVEAILIHSFQRILVDSPYDWWYAALIREDNFSRRVFAAMNAGERTYALYAKPLEG